MAYKIFIGSSTNSAVYVRALMVELDKQKIGNEPVECIPWTHAFAVGEVTIDALLKHAEECDAAVFVVSKDDFVSGDPKAAEPTTAAKKDYFVTRDNVVLELGIFLGRLGRDHVFFVVPKEHKDLHLPSDLKGVTWATYDDGRQNKGIAMVESCDLIVQKLSQNKDLPPRPKLLEVFSQLQKEVANFTNTRAIGTFPSYFEGHICELVKKSKNLWIASDVLTYGAFTDRRTSEIYLELLQDKNREVNIIVPTENRIPDYIKRQMPEHEWLEKFTDDKVFQAKLAAFEDLANDNDPITGPEQFYKVVVRYQKKKIAALRRQAKNHKIKIIEKDIELHMYLWIADESEAIFSIPVDKSTGSFFEHSFITKDPDLIKALRATWERYSKIENILL